MDRPGIAPGFRRCERRVLLLNDQPRKPLRASCVCVALLSYPRMLWCGGLDSNQGPSACNAEALTVYARAVGARNGIKPLAGFAPALPRYEGGVPLATLERHEIKMTLEGLAPSIGGL